jgi:hypothetical protein
MTISFDQLRRDIARTFNDLAKEVNNEGCPFACEAARELRSYLGLLMACHDDNVPDDINDLSKQITLCEI